MGSGGAVGFGRGDAFSERIWLSAFLCAARLCFRISACAASRISFASAVEESIASAPSASTIARAQSDAACARRASAR